MDLTPYVAALRDDLAAAATVGDEATSRAATSLAAALEPAVRLTLMNALSDLAAEVSTALDDHSVDLRLHGREVDVVVHRSDPDGGNGYYAGPSSSPFAGGPAGGGSQRPGGTPPPPPPHEPGPPHGGPDVGDISRMTLRIVDQIKGQAERAAAAQGMSLNSWVAQAVQGALRGQSGWPGGHGARGWPGTEGWSGHGGRGPGWGGRGWPGKDWPGKDWPGKDWPGSGDWSGSGWSGWSEDPSGRSAEDPPSRPTDDSPSRSEGPTSTPEAGSSGTPSDPSPAGDASSERRRPDDGDDGDGVQGWVRG